MDINKARENLIRITEERGQVLSASVEIESLINAILTNYFIDDTNKSSDFLTKFLSNKYASYTQKVEALELIQIIPELIQKLRELNNIRNTFAHAQDIFSEQMIVLGREAQPIKVEEERQKFNKLYESLFDALNEKLAKLIDASIVRKTTSININSKLLKNVEKYCTDRNIKISQFLQEIIEKEIKK